MHDITSQSTKTLIGLQHFPVSLAYCSMMTCLSYIVVALNYMYSVKVYLKLIAICVRIVTQFSPGIACTYI